MKKAAARISIIIYAIILLSTFFMPATDGSFVPIFGVCVVFAIIPIMVGSKKLKIAGSVLLVLAVMLLVVDYMNGITIRS